jgi:hypothetical protein
LASTKGVGASSRQRVDPTLGFGRFRLGLLAFTFTEDHAPDRSKRKLDRSKFDINQIDAAIRQLAKLFQIIAAIYDARIDERRGFGWHAGSYLNS